MFRVLPVYTVKGYWTSITSLRHVNLHAEVQPGQSERSHQEGKLDGKEEQMNLTEDNTSSSSYETPLVEATPKEPTAQVSGLTFSKIRSYSTGERLCDCKQRLLDDRNQIINEQGNHLDKYKTPFQPDTVTDPTLTHEYLALKT